MAKREAAAEKLKRRLEEQANTPAVIEEDHVGTPLLGDVEVDSADIPSLEEVEVGLTEEGSLHDKDKYTEIGDNDVVLSDNLSEIGPFDPENTGVDPGETLDIPGEDIVTEEIDEHDVFDMYDRLKVEMALAGTIKNPRVTAWSPVPSMILNYFKATRPSSDKTISSEINDILSDGLIERYPDLYEAFQRVINDSDDLHITNFKGIRRTRPDKVDPTTTEDISPIE
ncbi:MAG: hypothetical protein Q7J10_09230 [Methanosarcinaceae archaeon]|nr:hypothetical protein [Methanosarcinaceae archaeon]